MKKPFKETKVGKLLLQKIPKAASVIGDILPDNGVLGIVKNIVDGSDLPEVEKQEILEEVHRHETEMARIEMQDRDSARKREVGLAQSIGRDWMQYLVGVFIMVLVGFTVYTIFFTELQNIEIAHFIAGEVIGFGASLVFYYFGTSKGSTDKTKILGK
ncbi:MAG: hypothetical protein AAGF85_00700 [Bacteroidota bacterium]